MGLFNRLLIAASTAALVIGAVGLTPAKAALYKFTFEGEGANGYFIYDDSTPSSPTTTPNLGEYFGAVKEYKIDVGDLGVYEGSVADVLLFLNREGSGLSDPEEDLFILFVRGSDREPESNYSISARFIYPKNALGSYDLLTSVPSTATFNLLPYIQFDGENTNFGPTVFSGPVQTRITKVPEPASAAALLVAGTWFILRRPRQKTKLQTCNVNLQ